MGPTSGPTLLVGPSTVTARPRGPGICVDIREEPAGDGLRRGGSAAEHEPEEQEGWPVGRESTAQREDDVDGKGTEEDGPSTPGLGQGRKDNRAKDVADQEDGDRQGDLELGRHSKGRIERLAGATGKRRAEGNIEVHEDGGGSDEELFFSDRTSVSIYVVYIYQRREETVYPRPAACQLDGTLVRRRC